MSFFHLSIISLFTQLVPGEKMFRTCPITYLNTSSIISIMTKIIAIIWYLDSWYATRLSHDPQSQVAQLSTAAQGPCMAVCASLLFSSELTYRPGLSLNKQHGKCRVYFGETDSLYRPWLTENVVYMRARRKM